MIDKEDFIRYCKKALQKNLTEKTYKYRQYQFDISYDAICNLMNNNVAINLPTGTGKTMIANLISVYWKYIYPSGRILYIVPTRLLLNQHREYIKWTANDLYSLKLDYGIANRSLQLDSKLKKADVIISTPELFYNRRKVIPYEVLESINLIVVDEFDDFLLFKYSTYSYYSEFCLDFQLIYNLFKNQRFLLLSATSPIHKKKGITKYSEAYSKLIENKFNPKLLDIDMKRLSRYIPKALVTIIRVFDDEVIALDQGIDTSIRKIKDKIVEKLNFVPDFNFLIERLEIIDQMDANAQIVFDELKAISNLIFKRNFLYDDLFKDISTSVNEVYFLNWNYITFGEEPKIYPVIANELDDYRVNKDTYLPELKGKFQNLVKIIESNVEKKGVVYFRYNRLSDEIFNYLVSKKISCIQIDGRVKTNDLGEKIIEFQKSDYQILLLNRDSGGRGLDIPYIDYAVFYSPKIKEDTVWQELSRIRSTVVNTKMTYMMYYAETNEEEKMMDLLNQMKESERIYKFIEE
jgi:superfamily II DNA/RNA helicase